MSYQSVLWLTSDPTQLCNKLCNENELSDVRWNKKSWHRKLKVASKGWRNGKYLHTELSAKSKSPRIQIYQHQPRTVILCLCSKLIIGNSWNPIVKLQTLFWDAVFENIHSNISHLRLKFYSLLHAPAVLNFQRL